ncbi:MAG: terminase family protein [Holosporales bacterium]|jgi:phage terminase large subunit-like protein|nr:terminase family protein [Holosporales bacterium]
MKMINNTDLTWHEIARKEQLIPRENDWWIWLLLTGRGFGKTRTGAESVMEMVHSGKYKRVGIIGKNIRETKDVMVEGISGLLSTTIAEKITGGGGVGGSAKRGGRRQLEFRYYPSKNVITWENGAVAYLLGADNYEKLRGYQFDLIWLDEFAKYKNPEAFWQQALFTLRLGPDPKCVITTTPKPIKILKKISESEGTHVTKGSTFDNSSNLSSRFIETIKSSYENTRIGKQELEGELLMEKENAVWKREDIIYRNISMDKLARIVIGVDPAVTSGEKSDETGIIVAGIGYDEKFYVLADLSGKYKPPDWAKIVCRACLDYKAGRIVAETNNGGDLVGEMITTIYKNVPFKQIRAIKGKIARAEPISLLYEAGRVFHIKEFTELEEQMCNLSYDGKMDGSPDRVDALVWAISELKDKECSYNISTIDM